MTNMNITEAIPALTAFLLVRIAEDEDAARIAGGPWTMRASDPQTQHMVRWDPSRALTECEAKRSIVELRECFTCDMEGQECTHQHNTLVLLAQVYSDHLDFDPAWAISE